MQRKPYLAVLSLALCFAAVLTGAFLLRDRSYYLISGLILLFACVPFAALFRRRRIQVRELVIVSVMNNGKYTIILALCIMFIPSFSRIVRTGTLQYKDAGFVRNARVFGASAPRLLFVYILPNIFPILLSSVVIGLSNAILAESGMSYLGLGIQPPIPSLGRMLYEAQNIILRAPWCAIAPGLVIVTTIAGFHCIGEGLRKRYL